MHQRSRIPFRPMAGGQDLDELLKNLTDEVSKLKSEGDSLDEAGKAKLKQLEDELAEVKSELARQKAAPASQDDLAATIAAAVSNTLRDQEAQRKAAEEAEAQRKAAEEAASQGGSIPEAQIKSIIEAVTAQISSKFSHQHEPSSVVLEGATDESVAKWAESQGYKILDPSGMRVGMDREVKEFLSSKEAQFAKFVQMVYRQKLGIATDFDRKALAESTDSAGGYLVPDQWMEDILGIIRANTVVRAAGPRIIPFVRNMLQTSISTGATAYYIDENAPIPVSEPTFGEVPLLAPKDLTGLVPVSNSLLQDVPETEGIVRTELAEALALREDLAFIEGPGTTAQPRGFKNMVGITDMTTALAIPANGTTLTADHVRRLVARMRELNVRGARLAFFFHPAVLTQLELEKDTEGRYLLDAGVITYTSEDQSSGRIWGIPFYTSTQIPTNLTRGTSTTATYVLLVNMAEAVVGINKEMVIDMSSEASYFATIGDVNSIQNAFQQRQTLFRAVMRHDINHRRKNQILLLNGIVV